MRKPCLSRTVRQRYQSFGTPFQGRLGPPGGRALRHEGAWTRAALSRQRCPGPAQGLAGPTSPAQEATKQIGGLGIARLSRQSPEQKRLSLVQSASVER